MTHSPPTCLLFACVLLHATAASAQSEPKSPSGIAPAAGEEGELPARDRFPLLHVGVNLRTDIGTHPFRFDFGIRTKSLDFTLVLDPMLVIDGQHDADLMVARNAPWSPFAGYRLTTIALASATHKQHKLLLGLLADLATIGGGPIAAQLGVEVSTLVAKHGASLPVEHIFGSNGRDFIDLINFGMFLRFEYGARL